MESAWDEKDGAFLADFRTLGTFGATARGGVDREAATPADGAQRAWLANWLVAHGFRVGVDPIGNLFGSIEWVPGARHVVCGSHLDSQPLGGRYDGAYGVLAAAHAAHRVAEKVNAGEITPQYNITVVNWFNEEGSRFEPSMMGSAVHTGKMPLEAALATSDRQGVTVAEALDELDAVGRGAAQLPAAHAYAEIHVEQGRLLEDDGITIGLVESTWAACKFDVVVTGEQSHTGSTAMADRRDALLGAAHLVVSVRALADEHAADQLHTSVARFDIAPDSPVVVCREVRMNVDLRCADQHVLEDAEAELRAEIARISVLADVRIEIHKSHEWDRQPYQPAGVVLGRSAAESLDLSHRTIMTVAGHDSTNMKDVVPTVMLFVPSVQGIAHNEGEFTRDEDCTAGVDLFDETLTRMVCGELAEE